MSPTASAESCVSVKLSLTIFVVTEELDGCRSPTPTPSEGTSRGGTSAHAPPAHEVAGGSW